MGAVSEDDDLVEIETAQVPNVCKAHGLGVVRKIVALPDAHFEDVQSDQ